MIDTGKKKFTAKPKSSLIDNIRGAVTQSSLSYDDKRYSTPLFVAHETLNAFQRHNVLGLSAALSFYAMFALIPMVLLMFFLLSQLVFSSEYAIVKLAERKYLPSIIYRLLSLFHSSILIMNMRG